MKTLLILLLLFSTITSYSQSGWGRKMYDCEYLMVEAKRKLKKSYPEREIEYIPLRRVVIQDGIFYLCPQKTLGHKKCTYGWKDMTGQVRLDSIYEDYIYLPICHNYDFLAVKKIL